MTTTPAPTVPPLKKDDQNTESQQPPLSDEQVKELREKAKKYYAEEIDYLKLQVEYEELLARIEMAKVNQYAAMSKLAYMYAQADAAEAEALKAHEKMPISSNPPGENPDQTGRKLKID